MKYKHKDKQSYRDLTKTIIEAVVDHWVHKRWSTFVEIAVLPWGRRRLDVLCLSMKGQTIGIEVKSSKQDLLNDNKWTEYLKFVDQFYLAVPISLSQYAIDLATPHRCGVCIINPETGFLKVIKNATVSESDRDIKYNMLLRMAWRNGDFNRRNRKRRTRRWL